MNETTTDTSDAIEWIGEPLHALPQADFKRVLDQVEDVQQAIAILRALGYRWAHYQRPVDADPKLINQTGIMEWRGQSGGAPPYPEWYPLIHGFSESWGPALRKHFRALLDTHYPDGPPDNFVLFHEPARETGSEAEASSWTS